MLSDPGPAFDCLGDLADVAALHRAAIDALVARLGPYLRSIRFTRYHDVRVPVIAVSNDGSLGWLACEIEAEGQEVAPQGQGARVAYGFSWIETAIKRNGRWLRNGNASSARP